MCLHTFSPMPTNAGLQTWKAFTKKKKKKKERKSSLTPALPAIQFHLKQTPAVFPTLLLVNNYLTKCEMNFVLQQLLSKQTKTLKQKMVATAAGYTVTM